MEPAAEPLALIAGGHTALAACAVLYLAWWWLFFKPGAPKPRGGRYGAGVACIVGAAAFGGLSGAAQTRTVIKNAGLSIRHYMAWKWVHLALSSLIFILLSSARLPAQ